MKSERLFKWLSISIFTIYLLLVAWVVFFKCNLIDVVYGYKELSKMTILERLLNEINPIGWYIDPPIATEVPNYLRDDILNVVLFIPFGGYLSHFIKEKKILKIVLIALSVSIFIEVFQLFTMLGAASSKDLITNSLGAFIGALIYKKIYLDSRIKVFNICSIIVLIIMIPIFLYALITTIANIDIYIGILLRTL